MMPKRIQKSWQFYLSKIKIHSNPHLDLSSKTFSSSKAWIFRGFKHPKTSFSINNVKKSTFGTSTTTEDNVDLATMANTDYSHFENFNPLYLHAKVNEKDGDGKHIGGNKNDMNDNEEISGYFMFESPRFLNLPPNMDGPQNRFFIKRTSSGSLIEEARASMTSSTMPLSKGKNDEENTKHGNSGPCHEEFTTLLTCSMNPYDDFRRSMAEMIEERLNLKGEVEWEFMEELLFWYLNLNDEKSYKLIVSAFVDLMVVLHGKLVDSVPVKSRNVVRTRRKKNNNV